MGSQFRQQIVKNPVKPGVESHPWFWNPNRLGVRFLDGTIGETVEREFPGVKVTWNPVHERWQAWAITPRIQTPICQGWKLLFTHNWTDGAYCPPDERLLARLESIDSQRVRLNQLQYFDRIVAEQARDKERAERQWSQDTIDAAMPSWEYSQIKNIGKGNKFSEYMS